MSTLIPLPVSFISLLYLHPPSFFTCLSAFGMPVVKSKSSQALACSRYPHSSSVSGLVVAIAAAVQSKNVGEVSSGSPRGSHVILRRRRPPPHSELRPRDQIMLLHSIAPPWRPHQHHMHGFRTELRDLHIRRLGSCDSAAPSLGYQMISAFFPELLIPSRLVDKLSLVLLHRFLLDFVLFRCTLPSRNHTLPQNGSALTYRKILEARGHVKVGPPARGWL